MGASKHSLMSQFFTETILLSCISLVFALVLVAALLPNFIYLSQKELTHQLDSSFLLSMVALVLIVGMVAGSYPTLYLSTVKTNKVLKPGLSSSSKHSWVEIH